MCCFQLLLGKLYAELDIKYVFLASLLMFEVGSVICAAAPSSAALIGGRAVKGVGAAGVFAGAFIVSRFFYAMMFWGSSLMCLEEADQSRLLRTQCLWIDGRSILVR